MTIFSGEEQIIWEGRSQNMTAMASGGKLTMHYRLTTHYLYFEAGIGTTRSQQIPLIDVQDVDVSQTLPQKARRVGDVMVYVMRGGIREGAKLDSIADPVRVRDIINQAVHEVRLAAHQRQVAEQQNLNVHRFESAAPSVIPGTVLPAPSAPVSDEQAGGEAMTPERAMELLGRLGQLRDSGVITPEEFETKKRDLLGRI